VPDEDCGGGDGRYAPGDHFWGEDKDDSGRSEAASMKSIRRHAQVLHCFRSWYLHWHCRRHGDCPVEDADRLRKEQEQGDDGQLLYLTDLPLLSRVTMRTTVPLPSLCPLLLRPLIARLLCRLVLLALARLWLLLSSYSFWLPPDQFDSVQCHWHWQNRKRKKRQGLILYLFLRGFGHAGHPYHSRRRPRPLPLSGVCFCS